MAFRDELIRQLPALVFGTLAGKLGGPRAAGAFQGGMAQRREYENAQARQARLDEEQQQATEEQRTRQAAQDARADEDQRLQVEAADRQRMMDAIALFDEATKPIGESAVESSEAENQALRAAVDIETDPAFRGLRSGVLTRRVQNMAPVITRGVRADARQLLTAAEAEAKKVDGGRIEDDAITFTWGNATPRLQAYLKRQGLSEGSTFKPSHIKEIAGSPIVTAPKGTSRIAPDIPLDRQHAMALTSGDTKLAGEIEEAMRRQDATRRDPKQPAITRYSRATMTDAEGHPVETNFDALTGKYSDPDTGRILTGLRPPPIVTGGLGAAAVQLRAERTAAALNSVEKLKSLAPKRRPGPIGIAQGAGEVVKGYAGYSTKTRQYQALIQPTAMQMAAAIQGAANLSDNERKAMAETLGSIGTMDYESQMALLGSAAELLENNADVVKVGTTWLPATRAIKTGGDKRLRYDMNGAQIP